LKCEGHSKTIVQLKVSSPKASQSRFTELHAQLDADTLLDFAIHGRQNKT
jgi:hypothetical protein